MKKKNQNKSMISMMHRLVNSCEKYKTSIRAAYIPGFLKGMFMKAPLMICFLIVSGFMSGTVTKHTCIVSGVVLLGCLIAQAVLQNISDRLQSAAGFKVFADKRMQLGDHFRKLSMGYFSDGNIGKVSSVLATDMNFIEENCTTSVQLTTQVEARCKEVDAVIIYSYAIKGSRTMGIG